MIRTDYTFDASAKTVTFTDAVELERLQVISNVTRGVLVYNFAAETGTLAGLVLTLTHDTTAMADSDELAVYYGDAATGSVSVTGTVLTDGSAHTQPVSGTVAVSNLPATQPVSGTVAVTAAALPLPTGAATEATLAALNTKVPASPAAEHTTAASPNAVRLSDGTSFYKGTTPADTQPVSGTVTVTQATAANLKVDPSGVTSPVSAATLPLPAGASTAAKQPALGTAGTASADVLSVQGVASMTALTTSDSSAQTKLDTLHTDLGHLTDGTQTGAVVGNAASAATDSGNPVKIAGKYNTTQPTFTDGQRGDAQVDTRGNLKTTLLAADSVNTVLTTVDNADAVAVISTARLLRTYGEGAVFNGTAWDRMRSAGSASNTTGTGLQGVGNLLFDGTNWQVMRGDVDNADGVAVSAGLNRLIVVNKNQGFNGTTWDRLRSEGDNSDGVGTGTVGRQAVTARGMRFNGTGWDRERDNTTGAVIAAATTTTQTNISLSTWNATKLVLLVNISAVSGGSIVVAINGTTSTSYLYPILTSASLNTVSLTALRVFPGATAAANLTVNDVVPRDVRVTVTVTGTVTYGVDYVLAV